MTALRRVPISPSADLLERIKQALAGALPHWGGRVSSIAIEEIEQPFFKSWKILEVISPSPLPDLRAHLGWQPGGGGLLLLTGVLQHLHELATAEPPRGLLDDTAAEQLVDGTEQATAHAALVFVLKRIERWQKGPRD